MGMAVPSVTTAGSVGKFGHGPEHSGSDAEAARFLDDVQSKRIYHERDLVHSISFVAFLGLIQSQPHAGAASTVAAEEDPYSLLVGELFLKIGAGFFVNSDHLLPLVW